MLSEIVAHLGELTARCRQAARWRCGAERQRLDLVFAQIANIRFRILEEAQRVDGAVVQIRQAVQATLRRGWEQVHLFKQELISRSPEFHVRHGMAVVPQLLSRLEGVMRYGLSRRKQDARSCLASLNNLSPLGILGRGYSLVETVSTHQVIRDAGQVSVGQEVLTRLAKGRLRCTVDEVMPDPTV
jgi:exodeoxyribonuclease VII large subunit